MTLHKCSLLCKLLVPFVVGLVSKKENNKVDVSTGEPN